MRGILLAMLSCAAACGAPANAWDRKDAHSFCKGAIEGRAGSPELDCRAIHVCANEAVLSAEQKARLEEHRRALPDCAEP